MLKKFSLPTSYLLFIGTIEPRKNIPGLLKAYALLKDQYPDMLPLVLGGQKGWNAENSINAIQELNLTSDVVWFEDVPFEMMPILYNGATVLILPSFHEGFGMPAIEAMACGTPVVVAKRGALPEVVGENGIYVDPDDNASIAQGIETMLNDSVTYQHLKKIGVTHAATYTWQRTAKIVLDVYQKFLK